MSKRFVDTERFRDPWYRRLTPVQKCIWEYALSECNIAGILVFDLEAMSFHIGAHIGPKDLEPFAERFIFIREDLIFIPKFIIYQNGKTLNPANSAHKSIIAKLEEYGIDPAALSINDNEPSCGDIEERVDPGSTPLQEEGLPSLGNSNGKGKYINNNILNNTNTRARKEKFQKPTVEEVRAYCVERENNIDPENWFDFYESKGWRVGNQAMKDWKAAVRTWERRTDYSKTPACEEFILGEHL